MPGIRWEWMKLPGPAVKYLLDLCVSPWSVPRQVEILLITRLGHLPIIWWEAGLLQWFNIKDDCFAVSKMGTGPLDNKWCCPRKAAELPWKLAVSQIQNPPVVVQSCELSLGSMWPIKNYLPSPLASRDNILWTGMMWVPSRPRLLSSYCNFTPFCLPLAGYRRSQPCGLTESWDDRGLSQNHFIKETSTTKSHCSGPLP